MKSRFLPYATTPDDCWRSWSATCWWDCGSRCGSWSASALHTRSPPSPGGTSGRDSATGISDNLHSAGDSVHGVPLVGDTMSKPLRPPARPPSTWPAPVINSTPRPRGWRCCWPSPSPPPPIMAIGMPWLYLRIRFFRRKWTVIALAQTTAGGNCWRCARWRRPLRKLTAVSADPEAWRHDDPVAVRGLAELELRSAGVAAPRCWQAPAVWFCRDPGGQSTPISSQIGGMMIQRPRSVQNRVPGGGPVGAGGGFADRRRIAGVMKLSMSCPGVDHRRCPCQTALSTRCGRHSCPSGCCRTAGPDRAPCCPPGTACAAVAPPKATPAIVAPAATTAAFGKSASYTLVPLRRAAPLSALLHVDYTGPRPLPIPNCL